MKLRIAVFFGGRSPEHDVSICTGLQALAAIDQQEFDAFPVYISPDGQWWIGDALRQRDTFIPRGSVRDSLTPVSLEINANSDSRGTLVCQQKAWYQTKPKKEYFDVALLALHGLAGEDGRLQGMLEIANIPYTGVRQFPCGLLMDKAATKIMLANIGLPVLPHIVVDRPESSATYSQAELEKILGDISWPRIVKPVHLGSSIGVARVSSIDELRATLMSIFRLDHQAIIEPFVENLVEYNISVCKINGNIFTSAIERPKCTEELLDFKSKYLSGDKLGSKIPGQQSEGMLSLTREINPTLSEGMEGHIRKWSSECFATLCRSGAPRIDFLSNEQTGEVWLNEVNPCPGSFGYFLWEAARDQILFTNLLTTLIQEAIQLHQRAALPSDITPPEARIFPRN